MAGHGNKQGLDRWRRFPTFEPYPTGRTNYPAAKNSEAGRCLPDRCSRLDRCDRAGTPAIYNRRARFSRIVSVTVMMAETTQNMA